MNVFDASYQQFHQSEQAAQPVPAYLEDQLLQNYAMAHQHASMMSMSSQVPRTTETKPRLAKEDVAFLERAFDNNHKPSTQTKRGYAESMGVDLPRINNWFQNRRAKQKNMRKQEEFRNSQCHDAPGQTQSEPSSPDDGEGHNFFGEDIMPLQHSATFPQLTGPPPAVAPYNPQYADPANASMESLQRTIAAAQAAQQASPEQHFRDTMFDQDHATIEFTGFNQDLSSNDRAQFPAPESVSVYDNDRHYSFAGSVHNDYHNATPFSEPSHSSQEMFDNTPKPFVLTYGSDLVTTVSQATPTFPSQLLPPQNQDGVTVECSDLEGSDDVVDFVTSPSIRYEIQEPEESLAPPASSLLRAPPSADIASRRPKVHNKPAALGLNINRGRPSMGPRTVSHAADGFRRPSDSPLASPMRRIVSAGGNRCGMPGRVQKSSVESAQRSPINLGGFADAGSFMEHNLHNIRNPPLTATSTHLAPPTPLSPKDGIMNGMHGEATNTVTSPHQGPNYVYTGGSFTATCGSHLDDQPEEHTMEQSLTSPPVTPENALGLNIPSSYEWDHAEFHSNAFYEVPDAPIFTPAQDTFNLEIQMPQPAYIHSLSQPATPAVFQYPPNVFFNHESSPLESESSLLPHSYPGTQEYNFPGSQPQFLISPASKQKTFQFSNSTPADFSEK